MKIHGVEVTGTGVDEQTRCAHYNSEIDIIALKFKCCGDYFPCFECHSEHTNHQNKVWSKSEFSEQAVLCGNCGHQLTVDEYLNCNSTCPKCRSPFNPKCALHYDLYFQI